MSLLTATVRPRAFRASRRAHPWVFRDDLLDAGGAENGSLVRVVVQGGRTVGIAAYSARSKIALRLLTRDDRPVDAGFWAERVGRAVDLRRKVVPVDCEAYRLIFAESDGVPGLIVDHYAGHLVVQALTAAAENWLPQVLDALAERMAVASVLARNDPAVRTLEGLPREVRQVRGKTPAEIVVREGAIRYAVDPWGGQKTGAFLDQRENREAAARWCRSPALDGCCYEGAFALRMAAAGAEVLAVDSSAGALERGRRAAEENGLGGIEFRQANLFEELKSLESSGQRFATVALDPPAFAKSRADLRAAERAYKEINRRAMRLLEPGGILVTSSCSYNLPESRFVELLTAAAVDAGRTAHLRDRRTQAMDHPVRLGFPESHYLKCLILSVT